MKYLLLFCLAVCTVWGFAYTPDPTDSKYLLIRTNRVIGHAHMSVKKGAHYTGEFAEAVRHARVAKKYYLEGNYSYAVFHSKRARVLASQAITSNKVKLPLDAAFSVKEKVLLTEVPEDKILDASAKTIVPDSLKDQELLEGNLGIEL